LKGDEGVENGACAGVDVDAVQVACAAAAAGASLAEVHQVATTAAASVSTMGAALSMCTLPGAKADADVGLEAGTMELGLGIHGERGARKCAVQSAADTVRVLLENVCASARRNPGEAVPGNDVDRETLDKLKEGDDVAVVVNNLGGTTSMELMIVVRDTLKQLTGVPMD
jgi:triose/dihydroxyacetone kinase / FAD-AMP lyase (cyclizing)